MTEWRKVEGFDGWFVNDQGEVKNAKGKTIKHRKDGKGYAQLRKVINLSVHRAVMLAFKPDEEQVLVRHLDGDKNNNRLVNLAWGTHKDNYEDMVAHGRKRETFGGAGLVGEKNHRAKLSKSDVLAIRKRAENESMASIWRDYNVGYTTIRNVVQRDRWKHI